MAIRSPLPIARRRDRPEDQVVARFRERVLVLFGNRIERIVLFGSRAEGPRACRKRLGFRGTLRSRAHGARAMSARRAHEGSAAPVRYRDSVAWLATDELSSNIRDCGRVVHGPPDIPMIDRPVLQHARVALGKAERFAELSHETPDHQFEGVIHGAYYGMFHAARAALLAVEVRRAPTTAGWSRLSGIWSGGAGSRAVEIMPPLWRPPRSSRSRPTMAART